MFETSSRGRAVLGLLSLATIVFLAVWHFWKPTPPQMGTEHVFRTVDALFTAVTGRDEKQLADCDARLRAHAAAGKIPVPAQTRLDAIIQQARAGRWQPAAETLYDFMHGQRRDGVEKRKTENEKRGMTKEKARHSG